MSGEQVLHTTVLLQEAVNALITDKDGFYIDGTFGRGGHSQLILQGLSDRGRLLAFDKDPRAIESGRALTQRDSRFDIVAGSFSQLGRQAQAKQWTGKVSGVLLDLGVSSPQLDDAERGFSFMRDGDLDMRMDTTDGVSAAAWLRSVKEDELGKVLKQYGDEKFARRIAKAIIAARVDEPIKRTQQLAEIIAKAHPAWEPGRHPATKSFLAIRLWINRELEDLQEALDQVVEVLAPGGRLVVISFHSLEDRIVKRFIRDQARGQQLPRRLPVQDVQMQKKLKALGKPMRPEADEVAHNPRARSAIMRTAEKLL